MLHLHFCSSIHEFFFNAKSLDICFTFPHFYCTMLWNCEKCIFSLTKNYDPSSSNSDHRISIIDNCIHYKLMNQVNRLSVHHAFNQFLLFKMLIKLEIYYPSIFTKWSLCELFCSILMHAGIREFSIQWEHWIFIRNANFWNSAFNSFIYFIGTISPIVEIQGGKNVMSKMFKKFN